MPRSVSRGNINMDLLFEFTKIPMSHKTILRRLCKLKNSKIFLLDLTTRGRTKGNLY